MPALGCTASAIMESRHVDVIEMDAASHNGVDDVRQINEAVRYSPVSARYKVYILDEVHMLSTAAFNALLKTLEEPPPHVKFVFATTEIRKVPVTVLSRCQRFDLRRVDASLLVQHLEGICAKESISAEPEALGLIARAAEGSVRDALSLLDQAIAHGGRQGLRAEDVRQMLGLADRTRIIDLFEALHARRHRQGARRIARPIRLGRRSGGGAVRSRRVHAFRDAGEGAAGGRRRRLARGDRAHARRARSRQPLSMRVLSRTWQMLFKGLAEVQEAGKPLAAAEMVLVRIAYAADLPTPDEVIRDIRENGAASPAPGNGNGGATARGTPASRFDGPRGAPRAALAPAQLVTAQVPDIATLRAEPAAAPTLSIATFPALLALANEKRDILMKTALERDVRLVRFEDGKLEIALEPSARKTLVQRLVTQAFRMDRAALDGRGVDRAGCADGQFAECREAHRAGAGRAADPLVQAVLARFPGAEIVGVKRRNDAPVETPPAGDEPPPNPDDYGADDDDR